MALSNSEQEMMWVNGWNDLADYLEAYPEACILVPDFKEVDLDEAQGWIQESAYQRQITNFSVKYYKGKKSIFLSREPA